MVLVGRTGQGPLFACRWTFCVSSFSGFYRGVLRAISHDDFRARGTHHRTNILGHFPWSRFCMLEQKFCGSQTDFFAHLSQTLRLTGYRAKSKRLCSFPEGIKMGTRIVVHWGVLAHASPCSGSFDSCPEGDHDPSGKRQTMHIGIGNTIVMSSGVLRRETSERR